VKIQFCGVRGSTPAVSVAAESTVLEL